MIYESPDGGKTIYARPTIDDVYSSDIQSNHILPLDDESRNRFKTLKEHHMWYKIRQMAKENEGLQEILNQAIILYRLLENSDQN